MNRQIVMIPRAVAAITLLLTCGAIPVTATDPPTLAFHAITGGWSSRTHLSGSNFQGLELAEDAWLTDRDIVAWDLSTHWIYLASDKWSLLERLDRSAVAGPDQVKPFAVVVRGEICFVAEFRPEPDDANHPYPHLDALSLETQPADVMVLNRGTGDRDDRAAPCLVDALDRLALARQGLEVAIDGVWISHPPGRTQARVECEITLTNRDAEDLLIPDPARLGDQFYYLSWGLRLRARDDPEQTIYRPIDGLMAGGLRHKDFLVLLPAGASIRRTLVKTTMPVPSGTWICELEFPGMPGSAQSAGGVRIWRGTVPAPPVEVTVSE